MSQIGNVVCACRHEVDSRAARTPHTNTTYPYSPESKPIITPILHSPHAHHAPPSYFPFPLVTTRPPPGPPLVPPTSPDSLSPYPLAPRRAPTHVPDRENRQHPARFRASPPTHNAPPAPAHGTPGPFRWHPPGKSTHTRLPGEHIVAAGAHRRAIVRPAGSHYASRGRCTLRPRRRRVSLLAKAQRKTKRTLLLCPSILPEGTLCLRWKHPPCVLCVYVYMACHFFS